MTTATAILAGCEPPGTSPTTVTVRYQERAQFIRDRLVVAVVDGRNEWYFEGVDLEPTSDGWLASRALRFPDAGRKVLTISIRGDGPAAVGRGSVMLSTTSHERWTVDINTSASASDTACGTCAGISRFPITDDPRTTARDWLYVRWYLENQHPTAP